MRRLGILMTSLAMALFVIVPTAGATPPSGVVFDVATFLPDVGPTFGPFVATGPTVDAGLMCDEGSTIDVSSQAAGFRPTADGFKLNIQVTKEFTCDDGTGSFLVNMQVRIDQKGVNFNWNIIGGTDNYVNLRGTGRGTGVFVADDLINDVFSGKVHSN